MAKFFFTQIQNIELVVENGKPRGGSVVETMVWMKGLHALGHEIFLAKCEEDHRNLLPGFEWVNLVSIYHSKKFKKRLMWFSYRFPKMYFILKKINPDYLYTSIPDWKAYYIGIICKLLKIKHIIRVANDPDVDKSLLLEFPKHQKWLINASYKSADFVVAQNKFQYNTLTKNFPNTKVGKLFNPIVLENDYLKPKSSYQGYIAWLANFRYQKNLRLLYNVAMELPKEYFKVAGLALLPLDEESELFLGKLNNLKNVEFVGTVPRDEVFEFLDKAKFLLNTSRYEGFSNTFLESMVVGTPILTTTEVNPDGIIEEHNLGYIYKDQNELKNIIANLSINEYYSKSFNCIEYIKKNHDYIKLCKQLMLLLKKI